MDRWYFLTSDQRKGGWRSRIGIRARDPLGQGHSGAGFDILAPTTVQSRPVVLPEEVVDQPISGRTQPNGSSVTLTQGILWNASGTRAAPLPATPLAVPK